MSFTEGMRSFQADIRVRQQERIDQEIFEIQGEDIMKAASAMLEANVEEQVIKKLLIKYWDLRPSDASYLFDKAKDLLNNK